MHFFRQLNIIDYHPFTWIKSRNLLNGHVRMRRIYIVLLLRLLHCLLAFG